MKATPARPYRENLSRKAKTFLTLLSGFLLGTGLASGEIFIQVPGVAGDVTTEGYDDGTWFEAFSGTYGVERDLVDSSTDGTASVNIGVGRLLPIGMASHLNRAAAPLAQAAASGEPVGDVEIHLVDLRQAVPLTFSIIRLRNSSVKDFTMETSSGDRPWFQAFFVYDAIEIINRLPGPDGIEEQTLDWTLTTEPTGEFSEALQGWLDHYFTAEEQADPEIGGLTADIDTDGLPAVVEFKLDRNPWDSSDGGHVLEHWMATVNGGQYLEVAFIQRSDDSTPDIQLEVQVTENLKDWTSGEDVAVLVSRTALGDDREQVVYRLTHSRAERPKQFVRLSVNHSSETP
ncbi:type VI secretion system tube protein Hcp [Haloferula helveola]